MGGRGLAELSCNLCNHEFVDGERVYYYAEGTYNTEEEGVDFEFYGDEYICKPCWNKSWQRQKGVKHEG